MGDLDGCTGGEDGEGAVEVAREDGRGDVLGQQPLEGRRGARRVGDGEGVRLERVEDGPRVVQQLQLNVADIHQGGGDVESADAGHLRGSYI